MPFSMNGGRAGFTTKGVLYKLLYGFSALCFLFLKPITIKESTMSMFPYYDHRWCFLLISVVVGIYGVE